MNKFRAISLATIAIATAVTLSACSGGAGSGGMSGMDMGGSSSPTATPSPSAAAADFNDADVTFAQSMIPHHQDAVAMADLVLAKDRIDQRVLDLAAQIKKAQRPEITQLQQWLTAWGADPSMGGMSMGKMDMSDLKTATGGAASKMFLEQMKAHHQGAITMAQTERDAGANPDAKKMAASIVSSQTAEISTIDSIIATL